MSVFPKFMSNNKSLLAKHLTEDIFNELKNKSTLNNYTLDQAINSGVLNPDSNIGIYAGDLQSYQVLRPIFDPIIKDYHKTDTTQKHISNFDSSSFDEKELDTEGKYILSTRIRVGRNIQGYPLGTIVTNSQRNEIERLARSTLLDLKDDLSGHYYPLYSMEEKTKERLINDHFLFKSGDKYLTAAGLNRDWPNGRGIFHNNDKTFLVWVNEEDQLRIISMQKGGDIKTVFTRLTKAIKKIEENITFSFDENLGYISSCPSNLGTSMRASVHIKIPNLSLQFDMFEKITNKYHLQIRGIHGEHSETKSSTFDISNKRRLGITEITCIKDLYAGVSALIEKEKTLE